MNQDDLLSRKTRLIIDLANRLGFPMLVAIGMWYLCLQQNKVVESLKIAISDMKVSVDANTRATKHLSMVLHRGHGDDGE